VIANQDKLALLGKYGMRAAEFIEQAKEEVAAAEKHMAKWNAQRKENMEMLLGNQWCVTDPVTKELKDGRIILRRKGYQMFLTDNVLIDVLMKGVDSVCGEVPRFEAIPASSQQQDFVKAKYVTRLIPGLWYHRKVVEFLRKCITGSRYYNLFFGKVVWNPRMGKVVGGKPEGDISLIGIPPTSMFVDPSATRVMPECIEEDDARWLYEMGKMTVAELNAMAGLPQEGKTPTGGDYIRCLPPTEYQLNPADSAHDTAESAEVTADAFKPEIVNVRGKDGKLLGMSKIRRMLKYEQPSEEFPRGRYCLILPDNDYWVMEYRECLPDDERVGDKELPGLFPFVTFWDKKVAGQLAGYSRTSAAIPYQRALNQTITDMETTKRRFKPVTWLDRDLGIDMDGIRENTPIGTIMPYVARGNNPLPETRWPEAVERFLNECRMDVAFYTRRIEDRMSNHSMLSDSSRAVTATEFAHNMRVEQQSTTGEAAGIEDIAVVPLTKLMLQQYQRHAGAERMILTMADRNRSEVMQVMSEDIDFKDIRITAAGSSVPLNRALQKAEVVNLATLGIFTDKDPTEAKRKERWMMDLMNLESSVEESGDQLDINNARAENMRLLGGEDITVPRPGDNDSIHLYGPLCHSEFMKLPEFRDQPKEKYQRQLEILQAHNAAHMERLEGKSQILGIPVADIVSAALSRVKPGPPPLAGQQPPGPAGGLPPPPGQPLDFVGPTGVRTFQERPGVPKTANVIGTSDAQPQPAQPIIPQALNPQP
jgi:hypothetical protein